MATFPSYDISTDSVPNQDAGIRARLSEGGNVHGRRAYDAPVYRWSIIYPNLSSSEKAALDTFYDTYKDVLNVVTIDGIAYEVYFTNKPMSTKNGPTRSMKIDVIGHEQ